MKTRRGRVRSTIKWSGAVGTVLLLIVWVASAWFWIAIEIDVLSCGTMSGIHDGRLFVVYDTDYWVPQPDLQSGRNEEWAFKWWFHAEPIGSMKSTGYLIFVPIWFVAFLTSAPPFFISRRGRKRDPNSCPKCGYSRTGLPADRACPECGVAAERTSL